MTWRLKACTHCGGDLTEDTYERGLLTCAMCSRSYVLRDGQPVPVTPSTLPLTSEHRHVAVKQLALAREAGL